MPRRIPTTQLKAYRAIAPDLPAKRAIVYGLICSTPGGITDYEIGKQLGWPINSVTGRRNELMEAGLIESVDTRLNLRTMMHGKVWRKR